MTNTLTSHDLEATVSPEEWRRIPLDELVTVSTASGVPEDDPTLPFVGMEHVAPDTGEVVGLGDPISYSSAASIVQPGQVLYGRLRPYLNKVFVPVEPVYASREFIPMVVGPEILPTFLAYRLRSADFVEFAVSLNAGDRPRVKWPQMNGFVLGLPPLKEQERIVEILEDQLSRLDTALQSVQTVQEKAAQFRRSLLHAAFTGALTGHDVQEGELPSGWGRRRIADVLAELPNGKILNQGKSPQCEKAPSQSDEIWGVLKTTAIQPGEFVPVHNKRLPSNREPDESIEVASGDLLLTCAGPRVRCGVPCLVRETRPRLMLSGKMYRFRPDEELIGAEFLEGYLLSPSAQKLIEGMKTGTSDSGLNLTHGRFSELPVPLPPVEEQKRIVEILEDQLSRLDASLAVADAVEERSTALRRSLLHSAFRGRLTEEWREAVNV